MKELGIPASATELSGAADSFRFLSAPENVLVFTLDRAGRCDFVSPSWLTLRDVGVPTKWAVAG